MTRCEKCDRQAGRFLGLCSGHYSNFLRERRGTPAKYDETGERLSCTDAECDKPVVSMGFCGAHYQMVSKGGPAETKNCPIPGCQKRIFATTRTCKRHAQFMWRYSMTLEECMEMHRVENYRCGNLQCDRLDSLHLDHDHSCCVKGKFAGSKVSCGRCTRGWLCRSCNMALGMTQDSPRRLRGLVEYLEATAMLPRGSSS